VTYDYPEEELEETLKRAFVDGKPDGSKTRLISS